MNLYEIDKEIRALATQISEWAEEHDGDVTECPAVSEMESLAMDRERKILSLACLVREEEAKAKVIELEIARMQARYDARAREAERMRKWLESNVRPGEKFKDARVTVSLRESKAVMVDIPVEELPETYIRTKIERAPDKKAIGEVLKLGEMVPGCRLETRYGLSIK